MRKITPKLDKIFRTLCKSEIRNEDYTYLYNQIISSNETRIKYLNDLFERIQYCQVNEETYLIFDDNIDLLHQFINNELDSSMTVNKKYDDDKELCLLVPSTKELDYLFELISMNMKIFKKHYENKEFKIELPDNSFNQKMIRILEVKRHNLAHLFGLTDSETQPDHNKNALKKYFLHHIEKTPIVDKPESERLLDWLLSKEGQNELKRLNQITLDFIEEDKKHNPNSYDSEGNIKKESLNKFKSRYKTATNLDFPLIKYSRYITKCINCLNFLNMENTSQIILDYNAPIGKTNEKDIFIVNGPSTIIKQDINTYLEINSLFLELITKIAHSSKIPQEDSLSLLKEIGLSMNDKDILDYINIIKSYPFVGKHHIKPSCDIALEKIMNTFSNYFNKNIHLIGFDTYFDNQEIPLDESSKKYYTNKSHCDTSISLTAPELVGEYYKRGRSFFLDKAYYKQGRGLLRLSTPIEELNYLEQTAFLDETNLIKAQQLRNTLNTFNQKYSEYRNKFGRQHRK